MAIETQNLELLPKGAATGIITKAQVVDKVFDGAKGPEKTLEIIIQPKPSGNAGAVYPEVSVVFAPKANPLSALGRLLKRLNMEPDYENRTPFEENTLVGIEVAFTVAHEPVGGTLFARVSKDSIHAIPAKK